MGANAPGTIERSLDLGPEFRFSATVNMVSIWQSPKTAPALVITLILREVEKEAFYEYFLEVINDTVDGQDLLQGV